MQLTKPWLASFTGADSQQLSQQLTQHGLVDFSCDDVAGKTYLRLSSPCGSVIQAIYKRGELQRFDRLPTAVNDEKAQWFLQVFERLNPNLNVFDRFVFTFDNARVRFVDKVLTPTPPSDDEFYDVCEAMDERFGMRLSWFLLGLLGFLPLDFTFVAVKFDMLGDCYLKPHERHFLYDWYVNQNEYEVFGHIWLYRDLES